MSPFNAWVLLKGLETLPLRVRARPRMRRAIADLLAGHPKITRLIYPGRADHPQAATIKKQMRGGSNLVAFEIKGGKPGAFRFLNALKLVRITNNLGDAKSLVTHPATTTHQRLTPRRAPNSASRRAGAALGRTRTSRRHRRRPDRRARKGVGSLPPFLLLSPLRGGLGWVYLAKRSAVRKTPPLPLPDINIASPDGASPSCPPIGHGLPSAYDALP